MDHTGDDRQSEKAEEAIEVPAETALEEATDAVVSGESEKV